MAGMMVLRDFCNLNIIEINYRQSKRQATLRSTGANVNIMAVGCATPITIVNLSGLLFSFCRLALPVRCCSRANVWVCVCGCVCERERCREMHTCSAELYLSVWLVRTREIKLYMLLPISTAVTVHCLLRSASLLKRAYLCEDSWECENWGEEGWVGGVGWRGGWGGGTLWDWECYEGKSGRGGRDRDRKAELKWLKRPFWVERQVLLTFSSVCAT